MFKNKSKEMNTKNPGKPIFLLQQLDNCLPPPTSIIPNLPCVAGNLSTIDISCRYNVSTHYLSFYLIITCISSSPLSMLTHFMTG